MEVQSSKKPGVENLPLLYVGLGIWIAEQKDSPEGSDHYKTCQTAIENIKAKIRECGGKIQ